MIKQTFVFPQNLSASTMQLSMRLMQLSKHLFEVHYERELYIFRKNLQLQVFIFLPPEYVSICYNSIC